MTAILSRRWDSDTRCWIVESRCPRCQIVAARFFPALAYGQRRTLVRAIARMTEHPDSLRFEVEIRAAYAGAVVEVPVTEAK